MEMWSIILIITTLICGLGWLAMYISCTALIYYMKKKGYNPPNDEEMKECTQYAAKHLLR